MNLYLAAPWKDRELMPAISERFEKAGHTITHKWWETEDIKEGERTVEALRTQAELDVEGVVTAERVVMFSTAKSEGKATEQGLAIKAGIPIIAVGKRGEVSANVFHYLSCYTWVTDVDEALCQLI